MGKNTYNNQKVIDSSTYHKIIQYHLHQPVYLVSFISIDKENDSRNKYWWNSEITSKNMGVTEETFTPREQYTMELFRFIKSPLRSIEKLLV
ncbi:hypothetical protein [Cytobacillus sp. IB215316]|uniref:hypothetical protein n=1 Tax=Cytobacillus sp. IB215316 TaxID=3097354 RepID=UPI002A114CEC|nr:hypothetical protein [Cytobacillus sp. IB215316]MDX8363500.1 hypothetical protein [Cytobacillus sp. IB215316]